MPVMFCWEPVNNTGTVGSRQSVILVGTVPYLCLRHGCAYGSYTTNQSISHLNSVAEPESGAGGALIYWPPKDGVVIINYGSDSGSLLFYQRLEEISWKQVMVAEEFFKF